MTLVEIIVSILLAAITFATVAAGFTTGLAALRASRETEVALQEAQLEMEDIRNTPFTSINTHPFDRITKHPNLPAYMNGAVVVNTESTASNDGRKKVTVNVSWTSRRRDMNIKIVTYMTQNGINRK
jgi:type II secretory pathway pseudopilin PulG